MEKRPIHCKPFLNGINSQWISIKSSNQQTLHHKDSLRLHWNLSRWPRGRFYIVPHLTCPILIFLIWYIALILSIIMDVQNQRPPVLPFSTHYNLDAQLKNPSLSDSRGPHLAVFDMVLVVVESFLNNSRTVGCQTKQKCINMHRKFRFSRQTPRQSYFQDLIICPSFILQEFWFEMRWWLKLEQQYHISIEK